MNLKASQRQSEETVIVKNFKFFDLEDSGKVSKKAFVKAVDKIGVVNFSEEVAIIISRIFSRYLTFTTQTNVDLSTTKTWRNRFTIHIESMMTFIVECLPKSQHRTVPKLLQERTIGSLIIHLVKGLVLMIENLHHQEALLDLILPIQLT